MHWYRNIASSPIPEPQLNSIGVETDELLASSPLSDAKTDLLSQELLTVKPEYHFECSSGSVFPDRELKYFSIYKFFSMVE